MGAGCTAVNCYNSSLKGYVMSRFPKDQVHRQKWLNAIGRPNWEPYSGARVCHAHFTRDQWNIYKVRLKVDAIPTLLCICDLPMQRTVKGLGKETSKEKTVVQHDHPYAFPLNSSCCIHEKQNTVTMDDILKENCALQSEVYHLQEQLNASARKETAVFSSVNALASVENFLKESELSSPFSTKEVQKGLQLRFACGTSGYTAVRNTSEARLPSVRTLQRHTEHIKLLPGLHREILEPLKVKVNSFEDARDRDVNIVFDEMAIESRVEFDLSSKTFVGYGSLPGQHRSLAIKAEVYMYRGTHRQFKQLVGHHFISKDVPVQEKKKVVLDLIREAKDLNLNVIAIVCDMGNRGLLSSLGFSTKKDNLKCCIENPVTPEKKLWCMPDPVHLYKSLKEALCGNSTIELPKDIVSEYKLPSSTVSLQHIQWLEEFQRDLDLKFVPCLTLRDINTTHFSKMKVKSAHTVLSHKTSTALKYLVLKGVVPEQFETTAWFIKLVHRWFQLMTSRNLQCAFGFKNMSAYNNAITHLHLVKDVFQHCKFPGGWKPVQSHIIFATDSALQIQDFLLNERKYQFVVMGRFTQDVVENVFSMVRMRCKVPSCMQFRHRFKHLLISQFNQPISGASYDYDDTPDLIDLLGCGPKSNSVEEQQCFTPFDVSAFSWTASIEPRPSSSTYDDILYRMSGYLLSSLIRRNMLQCAGCIQGLSHQEELPHPQSLLQKLMDYTTDAQFSASDEVFQLLRVIDYNIHQWLPKLGEFSAPLNELLELVIKPALSHVKLSTCHDVRDKIITCFTVMRWKQVGKYQLSPMDGKTSTYMASKSVGAQYLAQNYNPSPSSSHTKPDNSNSSKRTKKESMKKPSNHLHRLLIP